MASSSSSSLSRPPLPSPQLQSHHLSTSLASTKRPIISLPTLSPKMALASSSPDQKSDDSHPSQIPKMEPFSRSRLSRRMREPSLLEKAEHALSDRCMALEGEEAYQCWEALFEFESMKEECKVQCDTAPSDERATACRSLERFENIVRQSNGVSSLISNVRMLARIRKGQAAAADTTTGKLQQEHVIGEAEKAKQEQEERRRSFPESGGLPPTEEELEEERSAMMPESTFTRLLRRMGRPASWFTHPPEHDTD